MEVHHHPHVPHGKKRFKEYFLEFIMIFLAVTLGFLAENLREHIAEKKKEKEYIHGFIADLKSDTAKLSGVIIFYQQILPLMDSTRKHFSLLQKPGALRTVMTLQLSMAGFKDFIYTDATLQQIKSSGGMLLIRKKATVDSLLSYDAKVKAALINERVLGDLMISTQHSMAGLLNMQAIVEPMTAAATPAAQKAMFDSLNNSGKIFLLNQDAVVNGQFYNDYLYYQTIATLVKMQMEGLRTKATNTLAFLQKEYHISVED